VSRARFRGTVCSGHKEDAVEVPFDPAAKWDIKTQPIRAGRRGFAVRAEVGGVAFDSYVVARSKKFWLLLPAQAAPRAAIAAAEVIEVTLCPWPIA
jgi:hypothetical protein